jgi:hypothetical protein
MKINLNRLKYWVLIGGTISTVILCVYSIYIDIKELVDRIDHKNTLFAQSSTLSDTQVIIEMVACIICYLVLLVGLIKYARSKNIKSLTVLNIMTWVITFLILLVNLANIQV